LRLNEYAKLTAYEHKIQKIVAEDTILPESNARAEDTIVRKTLELFQLINKEAMSRKPVIFGVIAFAYYYTCKNLNIYVTRKELLRIFKITKDTLDRGNKKINKVIKNSPILQKYIDMNYWKIEDILKGLSKTFPKVTQSQVQLFRDVYDLMSFTQIEKHLQTESLLTGIMINAINILGFATYTTFDIQYIFKISPSTTNNSIEKSIFYVRLLK
jgi:hypothetical protein